MDFRVFFHCQGLPFHVLIEAVSLERFPGRMPNERKTEKAKSIEAELSYLVHEIHGILDFSSEPLTKDTRLVQCLNSLSLIRLPCNLAEALSGIDKSSGCLAVCLFVW